MDDSESKKTRCLVQRPNRNKKVSEVSEEEEILDESKTKRETRLAFLLNYLFENRFSWD